MPNAIDITGQRFGRLVAVRRDGSGKWLCLCDCGKQTSVWIGNLRRAATYRQNTASCGCLKFERIAEANTVHGRSGSTEHTIWMRMVSRCHSVSDKAYKNYGQRGIYVCQSWRDSFVNFLADMGRRPPGHTLERIDNDAGYSLTNCKWATRAEQSINKRNNIRLEYEGKTLVLSEWAKEIGIPYGTLHQRLTAYNWTPSKTLTTPVRALR